jgi:hypothetical protein
MAFEKKHIANADHPLVVISTKKSVSSSVIEDEFED